MASRRRLGPRKPHLDMQALVKDLDELFGVCGYRSIEEVKMDSFHVVFTNREVSFADLDAISQRFGTVSINFGSEERDDGSCDTCSCPYSATVVRVEDVRTDYPKATT